MQRLAQVPGNVTVAKTMCNPGSSETAGHETWKGFIVSGCAEFGVQRMDIDYAGHSENNVFNGHKFLGVEPQMCALPAISC